MILTLLSLFAAGALVYIHHATDLAVKLPGKYQASVSYTDSVITAGDAYLAEAFMGDNVSLADEEANISIQYTLTFAEDGTYDQQVDEASYEEAKKKAYSALEQALTKVIQLRLSAAGKMTHTDEDVKETTETLLGMTLPEYLEKCGPQLLPSWEDICAAYNISGTYTAERNSLQLSEQGLRQILLDEDTLVLTDPSGAEPAQVYTRLH